MPLPTWCFLLGCGISLSVTRKYLEDSGSEVHKKPSLLAWTWMWLLAKAMFTFQAEPSPGDSKPSAERTLKFFHPRQLYVFHSSSDNFDFSMASGSSGMSETPLAYRPTSQMKRCMISISDPPPKPLEATLPYRNSSWGERLDRLPAEMINQVVDKLDFPSAARLSQVSFRWYSSVRSHPAHRYLLKLAPEALMALVKMRLFHVHSAGLLYKTLRTSRCEFCNQYGAFLFLPTCQRCCWCCLDSKGDLRVLPPSDAARYFGLSAKQAGLLQTFRCIPGKYGLGGRRTKGACCLVGAREAREVGLKTHGTAKNLMLFVEDKHAYLETGGRPSDFPKICNYTMHYAMGLDTGALSNYSPPDAWFGVASVPFPSLESGSVEHGVWCLACKRHWERETRGALGIPEDSPYPMSAPVVLLTRAYSSASLEDHVQQCNAARVLFPDPLEMRETWTVDGPEGGYGNDYY